VTGFDPRPAARAFWELVGAPEPFPRRLRGAIAQTLPIAIISLPRLTLSAVADWLARHGAHTITVLTNRGVRGCLFAQKGHAFIFLDGTLDAAEERVTLGHELAHFLRHYMEPRSAALALLGPAIQGVLDGDRPASPAERLSGVLRYVPIGFYQQALKRFDAGTPDGPTLQLEIEADLLAFELLAPSHRLMAATAPGESCRRAVEDDYGLPAYAAQKWAAWIDAHRPEDPFIARLEAGSKKIAQACRSRAAAREY
jgi:hypothetical protein